MPKHTSPSSAKAHAKHPSHPHPHPTTGLGRGLAAIIAEGARPASTAPAAAFAGASIRQIPLSQIVANPRQPRLRFVEEPLDELVASIHEHGVLQPITVRPQDDRFEIIAGERRFRACQKAGLQAIPALVKAVSDLEAYELSLIENLQREDLDPVEEARGYRRLADDFSLTQEQIAQKVGKNRATVANALRLLDLSDEILSYLSQGRLTTGHAKAILGLTDADARAQVARDVIRQGLNVRQTERLIAHLRPGDVTGRTRSKAAAGDTPVHLKALQDALQQKLGTRVQIRPSGNGGRIEIQYFTPTDLDRLLQLFNIQL